MRSSLKIKRNKISDVIISFLFFAYFLTSFLQEYIASYGINSRWFAIVLLLGITVYGFQCVKKAEKLNAICWLLLCWFCFKVFSLLWGYSDPLGIEVVRAHFLTHILMLALLVVISCFTLPTGMIKNILSFYYLAAIIICILQIVFHDAFEGVDVRQVITINGAQDDPNHLGAILNVAFCFSLYYAFIKKKYVNIVFMVISVVAILFTASRGALITLLAVLLTFVAYFVFKSKDRIGKKIFVIITLLLVVIVLWKIIVKVLPNNIFERLFVKEYGDGSGRLIHWHEALELFSKKPLMGFGWGGCYVRAHNTFLSMILDVGIIGTMLFLIAYMSLFVQRMKKKDVLSSMLIVAALVSAFFIEAITLRFFWNAIFVALILQKSRDYFEAE